jgi:hypothetical protein
LAIQAALQQAWLPEWTSGPPPACLCAQGSTPSVPPGGAYLALPWRQEGLHRTGECPLLPSEQGPAELCVAYMARCHGEQGGSEATAVTVEGLVRKFRAEHEGVCTPGGGGAFYGDFFRHLIHEKLQDFHAAMGPLGACWVDARYEHPIPSLEVPLPPPSPPLPPCLPSPTSLASLA